jgi:predicted phosphodiesterase
MEQDVKIGILSDIHAEPKALRRVLADMPSVDRVLCAGDAVSEYQFCAETVQLLGYPLKAGHSMTSMT